MDFFDGIPADHSVMLVMPALVTAPQRVKELLEELYIISLANRDSNIYFAILADFAESKSKDEPSDKEIIDAGRHSVLELNKQAGYDKFFFFYRHRVFHGTEECWMGRERKRGALIDFNNYILMRRNVLSDGNSEETQKWSTIPECSPIESAAGEAPYIKYVFTVDADCRIPANTIRKMTAVMSHPLNFPDIEEKGGAFIVKSGYGILQPGIAPEAVRKGRSKFAEIFTGAAGVDSYFPKTSDFYFDSCLEGIYTGKGMYEPAVFNSVVGRLFRKETVLSHDLLKVHICAPRRFPML